MPAIRWGTATLLFALAPTWTGTFGTRHVAMTEASRAAKQRPESDRSGSAERGGKLLIRGLTLAFTAGLFIPQVRKQDAYLWYIAQVDRFNPDNQVSVAEAELLKRAGAMASKVGGSVVDLGSGSGNDFLTLKAAEAPDLPVLAVEPNRFTWEKAASEAHDLDLSVSFAADLEEVPSSSCALLLTRRVLCSVDDEHAALMEIYRVLKPGGVFVFIEHVAAEDGSPLRVTQEVLRPVQQAMANNCDMARDTEKEIRALPWASVECVAYDEAFNGPLTPHIRGLAVKAG
ncbi:unnamed protein product [Cladocopium goreaui]|uniref:Thiol S-methyltransferase TMT1B (Associated wit h lipid droplet protein 1) (ALDI) (Methyltransferase-like protein 7B) (Thiol S-methyltransferase METTL7B) n=1 Tax=Cladocopium goreaui TaxID=2562237 RepID=A0A9P1CIP3_9DINO|nr:unnamed protein product [Cladocopium goreaui]